MDEAARFENPARECDVIMKGGITSGIVYPKAILALAREFRFRSIGGTSAGAIAAAITAAAEFGRQAGGFQRVEQIPGEMQSRLATLFQPAPKGRVLFSIFYEGALQHRWGKAFASLGFTHWPAILAGILLGLLIGLVPAVLGWGAGAFVPAFFLALLLGPLFGLVSLTLRSKADLKALGYGLCPGRTQDGKPEPALSDWLADTIEEAAGRVVDDKRAKAPLTFGDLWVGGDGANKGTAEKPSIDLKMMTTNLSMKRPHVIPVAGEGAASLGDKNYYFSPDEFRVLFPDWIVDHMVDVSAPFEGDANLRTFPLSKDLPIVVATRMSLSFPFLISAVPLYRRDFGAEGKDAATVKVYFSDGGITSNFPVHFFDALLPRRPTFGISLDTYDPRRRATRVRLPMKAGAGRWIPIAPIAGLADFAKSIVYSAKDWQDELQSVLSGYRERIVHIYLDDKEGGLNLAMSQSLIESLTEYGDRAGRLLVGRNVIPPDEAPFDFDAHRWRRFLVAFARIEETLGKTADVWKNGGFGDFITKYAVAPESYKIPDGEREKVLQRIRDAHAVRRGLA